MWSDALIIFKKESGNMLKDKRALFANFLLPIILMIVIFAGIGTVQSLQASSLEEKIHELEIIGPMDEQFMNILGRRLHFMPSTQNPKATDKITLQFDPVQNGDLPFSLTIYADTSSNDIRFIQGKIEQAVQDYNRTIIQERLAQAGFAAPDLAPLKPQLEDLASPGTGGINMLAIMLPYLLIIYLTSGPMGLALTVTANEKEQGALASLLVNQVSRNSIALGKTLYVMVAGMMSAIMTTIGIIVGNMIMFLSLQAIPSGGAPVPQMTIDPWAIVGILPVLLCTSAMAAATMVALGAKARNMKEGAGYVLPVLMLSMIAGISTISIDPSKEIGLYAVPILNSIFCIKLAVLGKITFAPLMVTVAINSLIALLGVRLAPRVYSSEKVLYTI